ncbi:hypothetical protein HHI36_014404, partial [Cryptolaemus montrouzieri]
HSIENDRVPLTQSKTNQINVTNDEDSWTVLTSQKHSTSEKQPQRDNPLNLIKPSGTLKRPHSTTDSEPKTIDNSKVIPTDNSDDESIIIDSSLTSKSSRVSWVQRQIKKKRSEEKDMSDPESIWISIVNMISEEPDEFQMSVEQIKNFPDKAYGRTKMLRLCQDFSPDAKKILEEFTIRGNKSRITRIIKKIVKELLMLKCLNDAFGNNTVLKRKAQEHKE